MKKYHKITPEGTKDFLFEECTARRYIEEKLAKLFSSRGFHEIITPGLEFYDVFALENSGIAQDEMYKATDRYGRIVVMRPDLTMPIARVTATRLQKLPKPVRLYYTQSIYRNNPRHKGRSDEITQTGVELLGAAGLRADLEVIAVAVQAMQRCAPGFRLEIGHAGFFQAFAGRLSLAQDVKEDIRAAIEKKDHAALNAILDTLPDAPAVRALRALPRLFGGKEVFEEAAHYCTDEDSRKTLQYLRELYELLRKLDLGEKLMVDLGLTQQNQYYTGVIFSAYVAQSGDLVLSGGRYDNLLAQFDAPMPAIGFAMNADTLAAIARQRGEIQAPVGEKVLVHGETGYEIQAISHMEQIAKQNVITEYSIFQTREEALAYARLCGIRRVDFVTEEIQEIWLEEAAL